MKVQYTYSGMLQRHIVRTQGVELQGVGITQKHTEGANGGNWNVYSLTEKAFEKFINEYPEANMY